MLNEQNKTLEKPAKYSRGDFPEERSKRVNVSYFLCALASNEPDTVVDTGTSQIRWVPASEVQSFMTSPLDAAVEDVLKGNSKEVLPNKL